MCANHEADELASMSKGKQAKSKVCSKTSFYLRCYWKVPPTYRMGLPISNNEIKKTPLQACQVIYLLVD